MALHPQYTRLDNRLPSATHAYLHVVVARVLDDDHASGREAAQPLRDCLARVVRVVERVRVDERCPTEPLFSHLVEVMLDGVLEAERRGRNLGADDRTTRPAERVRKVPLLKAPARAMANAKAACRLCMCSNPGGQRLDVILRDKGGAVDLLQIGPLLPFAVRVGRR